MRGLVVNAVSVPWNCKYYSALVLVNLADRISPRTHRLPLDAKRQVRAVEAGRQHQAGRGESDVEWNPPNRTTDDDSVRFVGLDVALIARRQGCNRNRTCANSGPWLPYVSSGGIRM